MAESPASAGQHTPTPSNGQRRTRAESPQPEAPHPGGNGLTASHCSAAAAAGMRVFNDPVHGHFELDSLCVRIIDTPQFQRLRRLKQLGVTSLVFPGAVHTRFEHSLGVAHIAGELVAALQRNQPDLGITAQDALAVQIAGLCHDLGHGPFSHLFDGRFIPSVDPASTWTHEQASVSMFRYLIEKNGLAPEFERRGLGERDIDFICEQIAGPPPARASTSSWNYKGRPKEKAFLYEIVANKRNGVDVDKWEYFSRDCYYLGLSNSFDYKRLMRFVRVLNSEGELQICVRDKEASTIYDMFQTRSSLHRRAYQHKTANIIEHMIVEVLLLANDHLLLSGKGGRKLRMSEAIYDMEAYTLLTDEVLTVISLSTDPQLAPARAILEKINARRLYKFVSLSHPNLEARECFKGGEREEIAARVLEIYDSNRQHEPALSKSEILVELVNIGNSADPIEHIRFYSKDRPNRTLRLRKDQAGQMLPERFYEQQIRIISKRREREVVDALREAFAQWCAECACFPPKGSVIDLTPSSTPDDAHKSLKRAASGSDEHAPRRFRLSFEIDDDDE